MGRYEALHSRVRSLAQALLCQNLVRTTEFRSFGLKLSRDVYSHLSVRIAFGNIESIEHCECAARATTHRVRCLSPCRTQDLAGNRPQGHDPPGGPDLDGFFRHAEDNARRLVLSHRMRTGVAHLF